MYGTWNKRDTVLTKYGGQGGMTVEGVFILFDFDDEKLFIKIQKPTQEELHIYEWYELTSPVSHIRRKHDKLMASNIPIEEWKKRLAWQPAEVIDNTLCNTTQHNTTREWNVNQEMIQEDTLKQGHQD